MFWIKCLIVWFIFLGVAMLAGAVWHDKELKIEERDAALEEDSKND